MLLADGYQIGMASAIFALTWLLITADKVPFLPIGRPAGAMLGGLLMILSQVLKVEEAYQAVDGNTIALLFGMMVITARLEKEGLFEYLAHHMLKGCKNGFDLLWRISLAAALLASVLTNDTVCVFMTPMVVTACQLAKVNMGPFLICLATSANIGSAATPTGNPQNMIIHSKSGLSFTKYLVHIGVASIVGLLINGVVLFLVNKKALTQPFASSSALNSLSTKGIMDDAENTATHASDGSPTSNQTAFFEYSTDLEKVEIEAPNDPGQATADVKKVAPPPSKARVLFRRAGIATVCMGVIIAFFAGAHLSWTAMAGAWALIILDFQNPHELFELVDWSLLLFFSGLFIVVRGFSATGLPLAAWEELEKSVGMSTTKGLVVYTLILLVASNIVSNVPTVLIVSPLISNFPPAVMARGWYMMAFITTVAGNFTLIGSVANIIVAQRARAHYVIGFWEYCRVGIPSTTLVLLVGVLIMAAMT